MQEVTPTKRGHKSEHLRLNRVLKTDLANDLAIDLMPTHIAQWRDDRLKQVQPPSVAYVLKTISRVLKYAMKGLNLIRDNLAIKITRPKSNKARTCLSSDEEIKCIYVVFV